VEDNGTHKTKERGCHVTPSPIPEAKANLADEEDGEDYGVNGIPSKGWDVAELSKFHITCLQRAEIGVIEERQIAITASRI
jgi:hypothetical protein